MEVLRRKIDNYIIAFISVGFIIWSAAFIYKSSFVAIDGKRYFCLFDDAMISMRYGWNFSHGLGFVWNEGERIGGYTNLLMTLLMSFATLLFDKSVAVLFIQILGAGFMLAIAYMSMKIADAIVQSENGQHRAVVRVLSFFFALSYYPLVYWTLMGMETGLLTLLLLLGILSALNYSRGKRPSYLLVLSVCLGLAFLTRSDSSIFSMLIWLYIIWETAKPKIHFRGFMLLFAAMGLYSLFVIGHLIFQYLYYGEFLPNTYTLKLTGMPLLARLKDGATFVKPFLLETSIILMFSIVDLVLDFRKQKLLLHSIVFSAIAYQVYVGGDPWNYWRIMSPSMPLLLILFISAINEIIIALSDTQFFKSYFFRNPIFPRKYITHVLVISLTVLGLLSAIIRFYPQIALLEKPYSVAGNVRNVNTAIVLRQLTTSDAIVGVCWAGSLPYFADRRAIDFLGKNDKYIAQLLPDVSGKIGWYGMNSVPGHNKYDLNYSIKTLKPTFVRRFQYGTQDLSEWAETRYVKVEYEGIEFFLLKDSPAVLWNKINAP